jgi:hypothetical protein
MTNEETRMANQTTMTNDEKQGLRGFRYRTGCARRAVRHCLFVIESSFALRHSSFTRLILLAAVLLTTAAGGCIRGIIAPGGTQSRRDVYMHLMTPIQQSKYLFMEASNKDVSLKLAYLQEIGVYQQWAEQPTDIQASILHREVDEGMTPIQVQMAWGVPEERRDETLPADRAEGHVKIIWEYGVRTQKIGGSGYERSVCFFDDKVLWVRKFN